ncbi:MAG: VOC family protein [Alphaproteobacteria bacterium]|nr:VOC family protein [Alphaproteobacteria bacterium]
MTAIPTPKLSHMGLFTRDIAPMLDFYTGAMGLTITDAGTYGDPPSRIVFMSNDPHEHHQFVLVQPGDTSDADAEGKFVAQQISFLVGSLEELQELHARITGAGQSIDREITHGNAWSFYFHDIAGNRIECYTHTPWYVPQPHAQSMDLTQPAADVRTQTERHCRATEGFMMAEDWRAKIAAKMAARA